MLNARAPAVLDARRPRHGREGVLERAVVDEQRPALGDGPGGQRVGIGLRRGEEVEDRSLVGLAVLRVAQPPRELEPLDRLHRDLAESRERVGLQVRDLEVARARPTGEQRGDDGRRRRERKEHGQTFVGRLVEVVAAEDRVALVEGELELQLLAELSRAGRQVGGQDDERSVVGIAHAQGVGRAVGGDRLEGSPVVQVQRGRAAHAPHLRGALDRCGAAAGEVALCLEVVRAAGVVDQGHVGRPQARVAGGQERDGGARTAGGDADDRRDRRGLVDAGEDEGRAVLVAFGVVGADDDE